MDDLNSKKPRAPRGRKHGSEAASDTAAPHGTAAPATGTDAEHAAAADASAAIARAAAVIPGVPDRVPAAARPAARVRRSSAAVRDALSAIAQPAPQAVPPVVSDASASASGSKEADGAAKPRVKLVRTSFSLAKDDHATLGALKEACRAHGVGAKKSQLLRVAVDLLRDVEPARLAQLVAALPAPARKRK